MRVNNRTKGLATIAIALMMAANASAFIYHSVQRGETMWGLAYKYKISADDIEKFNPSVKNGLKTGQTIKIPEATDLSDGHEEKESLQPGLDTDTDTPSQKITEDESITTEDFLPKYDYEETKVTIIQTTEPEDMGTDKYVARFGDTFKSISGKTGVSETELTILNPMVDGNRIREGEVIRLSAEAPYTTLRSNLTTVDSIVYHITPVEKEAKYAKKEAVVALMLPFELSQSEISRQALLSTDFYKGFLLATKDQNRNINYDLRIYAMDTSDETTTLEKQLQTLVEEGVKVVIPPDDDKQISEIEQFCADHGITVFNVLNIKDEGYMTYPNVLQCNISQKLMYDKAIQAIDTFYPGYIPVILNLNGGKDEKSGFTNELKVQFQKKGKDVKEITFGDILKESDLEVLSAGKKYIFIPKSGSQEVFDRISGAIASKMESDAYPDRLKLFGYPDWVAFRGPTEDELHRIGAVIYSRFNYKPSDVEDGDTTSKSNTSYDLNSKFKMWYGTPQIEVFPSQGTLGYDAGKLLLKMLDRGWPDTTADTITGTYSGEQSTFHFVEQPNGGMVNDAIYVIEFVPGSGTYTKVL